MYHFWKGYGSNNSLALGRHSSNDKWMLASMIGGSYVYLYTGTATLNEYCHLVYTYDGSTISVYQDNISLGTNSSSSGSADWSGGLKIGWWSAGGDYDFNGDIPVMKFYDRALTASEVASNFKAYKQRFNI